MLRSFAALRMTSNKSGKAIFRIDAHALACGDGTIRKMKIATIEGPFAPFGGRGSG